MKTAFSVLSICAGLLMAPPLFAQITIPNADGSDGQLVVSNGTAIINLANAGTGSWLNPSASPGNGTYDPTNWAVVFKYTNVVIGANATLVFSNHPTHAPVVWLVNGNVTINGNLNLDGKTPNTDPNNLTEPGPGGFRGGGSPTYGDGPGFGPGGGVNGSITPATYFGTYGNAAIIPLIGGSGGGGMNSYNGGGGGGAILIAATQTITLNGGYIHADGSVAYAGGSGGAVRLVANQILGSGTIEAICLAAANFQGRIRLEGNTVSTSITNNPITPAVVPANPAIIFPTTNAIVTVVSVGGVNAPSDPRAGVSSGTPGDDVALYSASQVTVIVQTQNFPITGTVNVYFKPRNNGAATITPATYVSGNFNSALWSVHATFPAPAHMVVQARAVF